MMHIVRCLFYFSFQVETKSLTLGEILDGDRMAESMYDIKFKGNLQHTINKTVMSQQNGIYFA